MAGTIICYGDSNTYGYDPCTLMSGDQYPEQNRWTGILESETDWKIENHGICGRCIPHTGSQIRFACEQLKAWQDKDAPVWMWIMLGTNDLLQEQTVHSRRYSTENGDFFCKNLWQNRQFPVERSGFICSPLPGWNTVPGSMKNGCIRNQDDLAKNTKKSQNAWESVLQTQANGTSRSYTTEYIFQKKGIIYLHRKYRRNLHG